MTTLAAIYRYPVKGLSAEALEEAALAPDRGLAHDRAYAIAYGSTAVDPARPGWLPKTQLVTLMKHERLAALETRYDAETGQLAISRHGRRVAAGVITEPVGRRLIEQFLAAYLGAESQGSPKLVPAGELPFWDVDAPLVSIIGRPSVADLERVVGRPVDPLRFRANLYFDGGAPWAELGWPGRELRIGSARLRVLGRIERCAATNVEPSTAARDMQIPKALAAAFGHADMGIYARVVAGGTVRPGDAVAAS